ncbi:MAG: DUF4097 family beta strand repeat-containing protein [Terracidiphilus sp.]
MSSVPPNMPPGGMPPGGVPPYDPRTQWRVYREQQKAAWRAQRDAWKAQRHAWKAGYVGSYGPRVPSVVGPVLLIAVGFIALFIATGHISASDFWTWYAHWWPVLLIVAGLALLGEWALDLRRDTPVRRGGSFIGILILVAIIGLGASGWSNWWGPFRAEFGDNGDDFFNAFGQPQHDNDAQVLKTQIPANAAIEIQNPRGDISIASADTTAIQVEAHEVAFANSDSEAKKIFEAEAPHVTVTGNAVLVKSDSNSSGRLNLTITVPHSAHVTVNAGRGDVTVAGLGAGINVTSPHGDVHLSSITGSVQVHLANDKHDFSAHQVTGDITADGNCNDLTLSDTKGRVTVNGEIFGEVHLESIAGPVDIHTSVTDVQLAELTGDLTLNSDDLRVTEAKGPLHVVTHAKDVDLSQIYGDTHVEDRDGRISVEPAGNYAVEAKNSKGDVELTLPPNASASIEGHTHNGDIVSDYELTISGDESKTVTGRVGAGAAKIVLTADNGDLRIKKGSGFSTTSTSSSEDVPRAPNAPHLKAPKALPAQPVTQ